MKLKSAITTVFSDAEISTGSKLEVVAFLRRYSSKTRPITHYSCRGQSTAALRKLLGLLDIKEGEDFTVAASSYDPEFNQIRWSQNLKKISDLVTYISTAAGGDRHNGQLFDRMYVAITKKNELGPFIDKFCDTNEQGVTISLPALDERHIAARVMRKTSEIVKALCEFAHVSITASGFTSSVDTANGVKKNIKVAVPPALEYLVEHFDIATGEPKDPEAPYVLPLPVLELYSRLMLGLEGPRNMPGDSLVFKMAPHMIDVFRLVRQDERLMWNACLNAPMDYLWNVRSGSGVNPLHGYFFRGRDAVIKARLDNKAGIFIGGNAALIHDAEADDNLTPALCVSNHRDFWDYVLRIYASAYGVQSGLSCQCRIGVPNAFKVWERTSGVAQYIKESGIDAEKFWREATLTEPNLTAMFGVFLGDDVSSSFSDAYSFLEGSRPFKLVEATEDNIPDFSKDFLTKEESAWEWFAMTHLDEGASKTRQNSYTYGRREPEDSTTMSNMAHFKELINTIGGNNDSGWLAEQSDCSKNKMFTPEYSEDRDMSARYTSLSAFMEGTCVSVRKAWSPDGSRSLVLTSKSDGSRDGTLLITNVYSGIFTDLSPVVGSDKDKGEVFPCPITARYKNISSAKDDTEAERLAFTNFLDRMANGKTMEQVRFAKRSTGTKRNFAVIVETNIDAKTFLEQVDTANLWQNLGTVFLQTLILNGYNPGCAFNNDAISRSSRTVAYEYHDVLRRCSENIWSLFFPDARPGVFRLPTGAHGSNTADILKVTARQDMDGRLSFVFIADSSIVTYAKLAYRIRCAFPINTAYTKAKMFSGFSKDDILIKKGDWPEVGVANSIISKHLAHRALDYDGTSSSRGSTCGEGDAGPLFRLPLLEVPVGLAPTKTWFNNYSAFIECDGVFRSDCDF